MINVFINGVNCPIVNDDSILITKKIVDIENPEQKQIDYSKGFLIQNTPAVATLFGMIFEVNKEIQNTSLTNFNADFNPNLKAKCVVMNDNAVVMSGFCQMIDIVILDGNKIAYNVNVYAAIGNFFNDIKNLKLSDISFTDLNHSWTKANVEASWTPTLGVGYVYPMINYGLTNNINTLSVTQFRPAIFVKDIIDRIFTAAGWSYSSAFLNSTRFKSLILPFTQEKLLNSNGTIVARSFTVGKGTSQTATSGNYNDKASQPILQLTTATGTVGGHPLSNDFYSGFNTSTYTWTCTDRGNYKFGIEGAMFMTATTSKPVLTGSCQINLVIERSGIREYADLWTIIFNTFTGSTQVSATSTLSQTSNTHLLQTGDKVYLVATNFYVELTSAYLNAKLGSTVNGDMDVTINSLFLSCIPQPELVLGDTINVSDLLPSDYLQKDFILSLSKMFNLYFDQINDKTLLIEPREDYYTSDVIDWTTKIDIGQNVVFTPMGMNQQKRYKFTYEQDTDRLNNSYFTANKEVYGSELIDIQTDFLTETKEIKPIFAATPLSNLTGDDKIVSDFTFVDQDNQVKQGKSKIRILYWGGLLSCKAWFLKSTLLTPKTTYPYAGHLDNPYNPTFDLNYGSLINVYYDAALGVRTDIEVTDNNLYKAYWEQTVLDITNKNSKVLEAYFDLSIFDFITLSFRKQYFIKEAYYRLLSVEDFDISGTKLTKCRLLKVNREAAKATSVKPLRGGTGVYDSGKPLPYRYNINLGVDGNTIRTDKNYGGSDNINSGVNTIVRGSNNNVPIGVKDVFILGSDSTKVYNDRVFLFNSDSAEMNRDGAMFNGSLLEYKTEFTVDDTLLKAIDGGVGTSVLPELAANEYYDITRFALEVMNTGTAYTWTGTGDIKLKTDTDATLMATILGVNWLGLTTGYGLGTVTGGYNLLRNVNLSIDGTWLSGTTDIRLVIYYKIVIV